MWEALQYDSGIDERLQRRFRRSSQSGPHGMQTRKGSDCA